MSIKALSLGLLLLLGACAPQLRGTGDMGIVIERAAGRVKIVEHSKNSLLATIEGLGDLSHASAVYSRDERFVFIFGRDGGLTKIDMLTSQIVGRVMQSGNSIGGAISEDGKLVAVANYKPGGVKVFDSETMALIADIPAIGADGVQSKVVGLEDAPGNRFAFSLYDSGEIWLAEFAKDRTYTLKKFPKIGRLPYDALVSEDGRYYIAGLFGEDGMVMLDLWNVEAGVKKVLPGYAKGDPALPVYKMPHLEGWAMAGKYAFLPAIGRHEVLVVDTETWKEAGRIAVAGQPIFVMARPGGRHVWVNFALPDNGKVQVIDVPSLKIIKNLEPGKAILHMEFTPRGEAVWLSARDDDKVVIYDTATFEKLGEIAADKPSGIFFTVRAHRIGL
jgi:protein NirF